MLKDIAYHTLLASAAGSFLSLDRTAILQSMVSRPIVASPVIGYMLGDTMTGLLIGCVLELLFIGDLPLGGYIPPNETLISILITAITLIGHKALSGIFVVNLPAGFNNADIIFILGFVILISIPMDIICRKADTAVRKHNIRFYNSVVSDLGKGYLKTIGTNNTKGLVILFTVNLLTIFFLTLVGVLSVYIVMPLLPDVIVMSLPLAFCAVSLTGLASAYSVLYGKRTLTVFLSTTIVVITFLAVVMR